MKITKLLSNLKMFSSITEFSMGEKGVERQKINWMFKVECAVKCYDNSGEYSCGWSFKVVRSKRNSWFSHCLSCPHLSASPQPLKISVKWKSLDRNGLLFSGITFFLKYGSSRCSYVVTQSQLVLGKVLKSAHWRKLLTFCYLA